MAKKLKQGPQDESGGKHGGAAESVGINSPESQLQPQDGDAEIVDQELSRIATNMLAKIQAKRDLPEMRSSYSRLEEKEHYTGPEDSYMAACEAVACCVALGTADKSGEIFNEERLKVISSIVIGMHIFHAALKNGVQGVISAVEGIHYVAQLLIVDSEVKYAKKGLMRSLARGVFGSPGKEVDKVLDAALTAASTLFREIVARDSRTDEILAELSRKEHSKVDPFAEKKMEEFKEKMREFKKTKLGRLIDDIEKWRRMMGRSSMNLNDTDIVDNLDLMESSVIARNYYFESIASIIAANLAESSGKLMADFFERTCDKVEELNENGELERKYDVVPLAKVESILEYVVLLKTFDVAMEGVKNKDAAEVLPSFWKQAMKGLVNFIESKSQENTAKSRIPAKKAALIYEAIRQSTNSPFKEQQDFTLKMLYKEFPAEYTRAVTYLTIDICRGDGGVQIADDHMETLMKTLITNHLLNKSAARLFEQVVYDNLELFDYLDDKGQKNLRMLFFIARECGAGHVVDRFVSKQAEIVAAKSGNEAAVQQAILILKDNDSYGSPETYKRLVAKYQKTFSGEGDTEEKHPKPPVRRPAGNRPGSSNENQNNERKGDGGLNNEIEIDPQIVSGADFARRFRFERRIAEKVISLEAMVRGVAQNIEIAEAENGEHDLPAVGKRIKIDDDNLLSLLGIDSYELTDKAEGRNVRLYFSDSEESQYFEDVRIDINNAEVSIGKGFAREQEVFLKLAILELFAKSALWADLVNFDEVVKQVLLEAMEIGDADWSKYFVTVENGGEGEGNTEGDGSENEGNGLEEIRELSPEETFLGVNFDRATECLVALERHEGFDWGTDIGVFEEKLGEILREMATQIKRKEIPEGGVTILSDESEVREVCDAVEIFSPAASQRILRNFHEVDPSKINHLDDRYLVRFSFRNTDGKPLYFYGALIPPKDQDDNYGSAGALRLYIYGLGVREDRAEIYQKIMIVLERLALRGYMSWCCVDESAIEINSAGGGEEPEEGVLKNGMHRIDLGAGGLRRRQRYIFYSLEKKIRLEVAENEVSDEEEESEIRMSRDNQKLLEVAAASAYEVGELKNLPLYMDILARKLLFNDFEQCLPGDDPRQSYEKETWIPGYRRPDIDAEFERCVGEIQILEKAMKRDRFMNFATGDHPLYQEYEIGDEFDTDRERATALIDKLFGETGNNSRAIEELFKNDGLNGAFLTFDDRIVNHIHGGNGGSPKGFFEVIYQRLGAGQAYTVANLIKALIDSPVVPHDAARISNSGLAVYSLGFRPTDYPHAKALEKADDPQKDENRIVMEEWVNSDVSDDEDPEVMMDEMIQVIDDTNFVIQGRDGKLVKLIRQDRQSPRMRRLAAMRQKYQYQHPEVRMNTVEDMPTTVAWILVQFTDDTWGYVPLASSEYYEETGDRDSSAEAMRKALIRDGHVERIMADLKRGQLSELENPANHMSRGQIERLKKEGILGEHEMITDGDDADRVSVLVSLKQIKNAKVLVLRSDTNYRQFGTGESSITHDMCVERFYEGDWELALEGMKKKLSENLELLEGDSDEDLEAECKELEFVISSIEKDAQGGYFAIKNQIVRTALESLLGLG